MSKKLIIIIVSILVAAGVAGAVWSLTNNDQRQREEQHQQDGQDEQGQRNDSDSQGNTAIVTGRPIINPDWGVRFALPARIDVTETRFITQQYDDFEVKALASSVLKDRLNRDMCSGTTLSEGAFVEISRHSEPGDERIKVGDHYYYVADSGAAETCYDQATYDKYYGEDVLQAVKQTLEEVN